MKTPKSLDDAVAFRAGYLENYQDSALATRYRDKVAWAQALEVEISPGMSGFAHAVAKSYFKLLAYKDEYEVARLFSDGRFEKAVNEHFEGVRRIEFHLAPPLLARRHKTTGEPLKMRFGPWMMPLFRLLAKGKRLRGTRLDPFGYTAERKLERQMIVDYEQRLDAIARRLAPATHRTAVALAALPEEIKGFGHVKQKSYAAAKLREAELMAALMRNEPVRQAAE